MKNMTLYDILTKYPELKDYFILNGFKHADNEEILNIMGKRVTLEAFIATKKLNKEIFLRDINEIINGKSEDITLVEAKKNKNADLNIIGILPCPVKVPLLEAFDEWINKNDMNEKLNYELNPASMGVNWIKERMDNDSYDMILSAGFDLLFDDDYMKSINGNMVEDFLEYKEYNKDFNNEEINLKDPDLNYSIISIVPAVFIVNKRMLNGKEMPTSWEDILYGDFENSVSLPISDFDLFNALLLNIYKKFGMDGVRRLKKVFFKSMHPSQMIKAQFGQKEPTVKVMPYFFTKMIRPGSDDVAVWPEDGAIVSPIFMLARKEKEEHARKVSEFFSSKEVGEILSRLGFFPSTNPKVDNRLPEKNKFMWIGWDYIKENNIKEILRSCMTEFNK